NRFSHAGHFLSCFAWTVLCSTRCNFLSFFLSLFFRRSFFGCCRRIAALECLNIFFSHTAVFACPCHFIDVHIFFTCELAHGRHCDDTAAGRFFLFFIFGLGHFFIFFFLRVVFLFIFRFIFGLLFIFGFFFFRCFLFSSAAVFRTVINRSDQGTDSCRLSLFDRQSCGSTVCRRWNLHHRFILLAFRKNVSFFHFIAFCDHPLRYFTFVDTFTDIRHFQFKSHCNSSFYMIFILEIVYFFSCFNNIIFSRQPYFFCLSERIYSIRSRHTFDWCFQAQNHALRQFSCDVCRDARLALCFLDNHCTVCLFNGFDKCVVIHRRYCPEVDHFCRDAVFFKRFCSFD